mmetsp:Transcript_16673/g.51805  ORF Transcript_16673/g.51805 Transcript_16673/m.51805 type:complete len:239 (-) Transcript_16673:73-789(-)
MHGYEEVIDVLLLPALLTQTKRCPRPNPRHIFPPLARQLAFKRRRHGQHGRRVVASRAAAASATRPCSRRRPSRGRPRAPPRHASLPLPALAARVRLAGGRSAPARRPPSVTRAVHRAARAAAHWAAAPAARNARRWSCARVPPPPPPMVVFPPPAVFEATKSRQRRGRGPAGARDASESVRWVSATRRRLPPQRWPPDRAAQRTRRTSVRPARGRALPLWRWPPRSAARRAPPSSPR